MLVLTLLLNREFAWRRAIATGNSRRGVGDSVLADARKHVERGARRHRDHDRDAAHRMIRERKFMAETRWRVADIAAATFVPSRLESTTCPAYVRQRHRSPSLRRRNPRRAREFGPGPSNRFAIARAGFASTSAGFEYRSRTFNSRPGDIVRFSARAVIGFFAPFPRMWVQTGSYGRAGRLISGAETLAMYFLYVAVAVCLVAANDETEMWLVFLVATAGLISVGPRRRKRGRALSNPVRVLDDADRDRGAGRSLLDRLAHKLTKSRMSSSVVSNDAISRTSEISSFQT
jgi:hypothetical protein